MMEGAVLPALLALVPAMVGPLPIEQGSRSLVMALCGGGSIQISLQDEGGMPAVPATTPCCAKGCHSQRRKRLLDPLQ